MNRFIDMDKLVLPKGTVDNIQKRGVPAILDLLAEQESIDIVRCKDCKYYTESKYFAPEKMCYRYKDNERNKIGYIKSDNDFCSMGERRDTE